MNLFVIPSEGLGEKKTMSYSFEDRKRNNIT